MYVCILKSGLELEDGRAKILYDFIMYFGLLVLALVVCHLWSWSLYVIVVSVKA